ncbi:MAG: hypothetical protein ACKVQQ_16725, partial [Burkholderiales bacterium]
TRAPPRLPMPGRCQRTLRAPSEPGITSPASGLAAMKSINASRYSSLHTSAACFRNVGVSTTVRNIPLLYPQ